MKTDGPENEGSGTGGATCTLGGSLSTLGVASLILATTVKLEMPNNSPPFLTQRVKGRGLKKWPPGNVTNLS